MHLSHNIHHSHLKICTPCAETKVGAEIGKLVTGVKEVGTDLVSGVKEVSSTVVSGVKEVGKEMGAGVVGSATVVSQSIRTMLGSTPTNTSASSPTSSL